MSTGTADEIVHNGATLTELGFMFGLAYGTVKNKMAGARPSGTRNGKDVFRLRDAAPRLIKVTEDDAMVNRILNMNHTELPKMLSKEYWQGQLNRQKYEKERGDLWETTKIIEYVGNAYKTLRLSLQLMIDAVERETTLTEVQRRVIQDMIDATLDDMRESLQNGIKDQRKPTSYETAPSQEDDRYADL